MKTVVCEQGVRPCLPPVWNEDSTLRVLYNIMTECWYVSGDRLPAMRIKKNLNAQRNQLLSLKTATPNPHHQLHQNNSLSPSELPPGVFRYQPAKSKEDCDTVDNNQGLDASPPAEFNLLRKQPNVTAIQY